MRFSLLILASLAAVGLASPSPAAFPPLSDNVLRDLRSRDPASYSVYSLQNDTGLAARAAPNGLTGVQLRGSASRSFAYTFDDGPYVNQKRISQFFSDKGSKTTFFVNGNNYRCVLRVCVWSVCGLQAHGGLAPAASTTRPACRACATPTPRATRCVARAAPVPPLLLIPFAYRSACTPGRTRTCRSSTTSSSTTRCS
jgi:hypothetical protein